MAMKTYGRIALLSSLLLFLSGCGAQTVKPGACPEVPPDIQIIEKPAAIPADLLTCMPCPQVPTDGSDNEALVSWAENCAMAAQECYANADRIRGLQP